MTTRGWIPSATSIEPVVCRKIVKPAVAQIRARDDGLEVLGHVAPIARGSDAAS